MRGTESLSRDGDHQEAGTALNRAASLWERHSVEENPERLDWFGEAQPKSTEGKVLLRTGQLDRATKSLETSVDKATPRDRAVRSARLAGNDLDGALAASTYGAELIEDNGSSVRALDRLKELAEQLPREKTAPVAVREFRERLQTLPDAA